jgi:hypothetical protein
VGELPLRLGEAFSIATVNLPTLVSVEATGVYIPIGKSEILLSSVYKSPGRAWSDADIVELLRFRSRSILAGDLNAEHPFWNSAG